MRTLLLPFACLLALAAIVPRPAAATEVAGKIEVTAAWLTSLEERIAAQPNQPPPTSYWQVGNGAASVEPPVVFPAEEFGILIRPTERRDLDPLAVGEPEVELRSMAFFPSVTYVAEGMSLVIRNMDLFDHELVVQDEKGTEPLAMEPIDGDRAFRVRFKTRGTYVIACKLYPFVRAYVVVDSGALRFVRPSADGTFAFGEIPEGKYTLTVFNATQMASAAPSPVAGWVTGSCTFDVPAAPPTPSPSTPPAGAAAETPAAPPPVFQVTVRLGGRGASEALECSGAWPQPPAAPAAAGQR